MDIFSLPIVEVAISIIISWALFAIFCSMIHESFVQMKSERGRFFKKYVLQQLFDNPNQINWGSLIYTSSAVDLLSREYNKPPSEISPKIFSEALIETIANAHIVQTARRMDAGYVPKYQNKLLDDFAYGTNTLLPSSIISFLKSSLIKAEIKAGNDGKSNYSEEKLYNCLVADISDWYTQLCERTSIWYGKATKLRLFFLGLAISLILNVDSIRMFKYFNSNPNARAATIEFYKKNEAQLNALAIKYDAINKGNPIPEAEFQKDKTEFEQKTKVLIEETKLPIGWETNLINAHESNDWQSILFKILGYAISAFAAAVGAPFWFDILKKANPLKNKTS